MRRLSPREVARSPDGERELGELRRLKDGGSKGDPTARAVHRLTDYEHGQQEADARHHEPGREQTEPAEVEPRRENHQDETEARVHPLPHEEEVRIAVPQCGRRRGGAIDHHKPERQQRKRYEREKTSLELSRLHPAKFCTSNRNSSPRCSKSRNWS